MRTFVGAVLVAMVLGGVPGIARADETRIGTLGTGIDIYNAQCKSAKTHCLFAYVCDESQGAARWAMTMTAITPTTMYGKGNVTTADGGDCNTAGVLLCRSGLTAGAMKAIITVTLAATPCPACSPGNTFDYALNFGCFDKFLNVLPDASDDLIRTTHIVN